MKERGKSSENIIDQYFGQVLQGYKKFIQILLFIMKNQIYILYIFI
jgi:hypothetical protein